MEADGVAGAPTQQSESADGLPASPVVINTDSDSSAAAQESLPSLPLTAVYEFPITPESNINPLSVSSTPPVQQIECVPGAVVTQKETHQNYAFEDHSLSGMQDSIYNNEFQMPAQSNPNSASEQNISPTQYGDCDQGYGEFLEQAIQIYPSENQGTSATQDLLYHYKSLQPMGYDTNNPLETGVSPTQLHVCIPDAFVAAVQDGHTFVPDARGVSGSQHVVSAHHVHLLSASEPHVFPTEQGGNVALEQSIPMYPLNNEDTSGTQYLQLPSHYNSPVSVESYVNTSLEPEMSQNSPHAYMQHAQPLHIHGSDEHGTSGPLTMMVSATQESPLLSQNTTVPLQVCPINQGVSASEIFEGLPQIFYVNGAEPQLTSGPVTVTTAAQESHLPPENNAIGNSVPHRFSVQRVECAPRNFQSLHRIAYPHASNDQSASVTPEPGTNVSTKNVYRSEENHVGGIAMFTSYIDGVKDEENQYAVQQEVSSIGSASRSVRSSSSSKSSSVSSPDMFSSRLSLFDTDDETDVAESYDTMMSLVDLYSDYFEDLEENQSEEYVVTMITAYVEMASNRIGDLRVVAARIFTSPYALGNLLYDISWTTLYLAVDDEVDLYDVGSWFKLRLLAVKAYIRTTCESTAEGAIAEAIRREFLGKEELAAVAQPAFPGARNGCTVQLASRLQEIGVEEAAPNGVLPASHRMYGGSCSRGKCEQDYTESQRRLRVDDRTRQRAAVLKIFSIAEERVCRIRAINWVMLGCFKTVLNVLGLGLEAKRMAERAVKEAMRQQLPGTHHVVAAAAEVAIAASCCNETALKLMEHALQLHRAVVEALRRAERSLYCLSREASCGRNDLMDILCCVDTIEEAVQRACEIYLDKVGTEAAGDSRGPSELPTPTTVNERIDKHPTDVFQALFWATQSAVKGIDVTLRGLQRLSYSVLFNPLHAGRLPCFTSSVNQQ